MYLSPQRFNRWLLKIGQQLIWRRSYACACVNPTSGAADPKHQLCNGKGRLWAAGVETVAGVVHQASDASMIQSGQFDAGDMLMSVPENSPMWDMGRFDRVLMKNSTDVFSLPLKRGAPNERVTFTVKSLIRAFKLDPVTRLDVDLPLPVIDVNGFVTWPNNDGPQDGETYSLTGERYDEYYVFRNYPSDRGEHSGARLPKRVQLRLFDLFNRSNVGS